MDTESVGKVNFDEFRAFCNAVVIETEDATLSGRSSVDENGEIIIMDSARLSARVTKELERDLALRKVFNALGATLSSNNLANKEQIAETMVANANNKSAEQYISKRYILRALHSNPSIVIALTPTD